MGWALLGDFHFLDEVAARLVFEVDIDGINSVFAVYSTNHIFVVGVRDGARKIDFERFGFCFGIKIIQDDLRMLLGIGALVAVVGNRNRLVE